MHDTDLRRLAAHHEEEAMMMKAQKSAFEKGEVFSLSGSRSADHDDWVKETIGQFARLEKEHLAFRDHFLSRVGAETA